MQTRSAKIRAKDRIGEANCTLFCSQEIATRRKNTVLDEDSRCVQEMGRIQQLLHTDSKQLQLLLIGSFSMIKFSSWKL